MSPAPRGLLDRGRTALVVVDVQEAFRKAVLDFDGVAGRAGLLVQGANIMGTPVVITEQYPQGLGATVPEGADHAEGTEALPKTVFSSAAAEGFDLEGRYQVLMCGIEAHVCVSQTAHDLLHRGVEVHVASDAVSSRSVEDKEAGLRKMESSGATLTSVEMALFELLGEAGSDEFKQIQKLVK